MAISVVVYSAAECCRGRSNRL